MPHKQISEPALKNKKEKFSPVIKEITGAVRHTVQSLINGKFFLSGELC